MGGAGRIFKISLKQRKPRPEMSSHVDQSDKKISWFAIACWRLPWIHIPKDMSGFYDPRFYDSRFPFYDMQQQQMPLPFVFNASTSPPIPQNSQQPEGARGAQSSLRNTPSPETSSFSSVEEDNGEKTRKPKSYDKWTHGEQQVLVRLWIRLAGECSTHRALCVVAVIADSVAVS